MRKFILGLIVISGLASLSASDDVHGPVVIATETITASTSSVDPITVVTPTVDSGYIVTGHISVNGSANNGSTNVLAEADYTNTLGSSTANRVPISGTSGRVDDNFAFMYVKAGTPVIFKVTYDGGTSNDTYDVVFTFIKQ